jgi:uncharacterized protein YjbI with pentapeptide repeats
MSRSLVVVIAIACVLAFVAVVTLGYRRKWAWTGLPEHRYTKPTDEDVIGQKTLWDWMQLLFIPLVLAGGAFLLNDWQSQRDEARADAQRKTELAASQVQAERAQALALDDQREQALRQYLDSMTSLILDRGLATSSIRSEVRAVARTLTLTTLDRVDGRRKGSIVRFLYEANLIYESDWRPSWSNCPYRTAEQCYGFPTIIDLSGANLAGADLHGARLEAANLARVNLEGADLSSAVLVGVDLSDVDLSNANLVSTSFGAAHMENTSFDRADLRDASFRDAIGECNTFTYSDLSNASFHGAHLWAPNFDHSELTGVVFRQARLTYANFSSVTFQTMPDFLNAHAPGEFPTSPSANAAWHAARHCFTPRIG